MARLLDLTASTFGFLRVLGRGPNQPHGNQGFRTTWICLCNRCGRTTTVSKDNLQSGRTRSCGCLKKDTDRNGHPTHEHTRGAIGTRTYNSWRGAKDRCHNKNHKAFQYYGARGISMSPLWRWNFAQFLLDMGIRPVGCTLDRIDNDGNYEPGNCRWATLDVQTKNRRPRRRTIAPVQQGSLLAPI